ncbi:MAG: hypothetical protein GEV11_14440 [Streptosporangiales bacterium]|nr:hypothetical protein [Streptosporangiales bacterium]
MGVIRRGNRAWPSPILTSLLLIGFAVSLFALLAPGLVMADDGCLGPGEPPFGCTARGRTLALAVPVFGSILIVAATLLAAWLGPPARRHRRLLAGFAGVFAVQFLGLLVAAL